MKRKATFTAIIVIAAAALTGCNKQARPLTQAPNQPMVTMTAPTRQQSPATSLSAPTSNSGSDQFSPQTSDSNGSGGVDVSSMPWVGDEYPSMVNSKRQYIGSLDEYPSYRRFIEVDAGIYGDSVSKMSDSGQRRELAYGMQACYLASKGYSPKETLAWFVKNSQSSSADKEGRFMDAAGRILCPKQFMKLDTSGGS